MSTNISIQLHNSTTFYLYRNIRGHPLFSTQTKHFYADMILNIEQAINNVKLLCEFGQRHLYFINVVEDWEAVTVSPWVATVKQNMKSL